MNKKTKYSLYILAGVICATVIKYSLAFFIFLELVLPIHVQAFTIDRCTNVRGCSTTKILDRNGTFKSIQKNYFERFIYFPIQKKSPLDILDEYENFQDINKILNEKAYAFDYELGGEPIPAIHVVKYVLEDKEYNPLNPIATNEALFDDVFSKFNLLQGPKADRFIIEVSTALYHEFHKTYPWSLKDYSKVELHNVIPYTLDEDYLESMLTNNVNKLYVEYYVDNIVTDAQYKQNILAKKIIGDATSPKEAIMRIVNWHQRNFFHAYSNGEDEDYGWDKYLDGDEPPSNGMIPLPKSIDRIYEERIIDCHIPTTLISGMLHSLNIPALKYGAHGHSVLYLPSLNGYVHGDHIAMNAHSGDYVIFTKEEFQKYASIEDDGGSWNMLHDIVSEKAKPFIWKTGWTKRIGENLYINANYGLSSNDIDCTDDAEHVNLLKEWFPEYIFSQVAPGCKFKSDLVPIKTLYELSQ